MPALLDRLSVGGRRLDVLSVYLDEGVSFFPPAWAGREIKEGLDRRAIAIDGIADHPTEPSVSNSGLEALLDLLDRAHSTPVPQPRAEAPPKPVQAPAAATTTVVVEKALAVEGQEAEPRAIPVTKLQQFRHGLTGVLGGAATAIPSEREGSQSAADWAGDRARR